MSFLRGGVTNFMDGFIPQGMLPDREARTRARMFMFSHFFGPVLSSVIPGYLFWFDASSKWKLLLLSSSIFSFWAYPFVVKRTGRYELLSHISIQNLLFAITWGCYFYGGLSSPFLPWLVTVPLLAFFYLKATAKSVALISTQIAGSVLVFGVAIELCGAPHTIPTENMHVIGMISIASSAIYVSMMALYYAGILASQSEFEDEARRHIETSAELRVAMRKAERASAAKAEFLARTSHELRTPLNAVIGFSEVLLEETDPGADPQGVEDLRKIYGAGRHLLSLINAILDLSKIEAGRMEVFAEHHAVRPMLAAIVQRAKSAAMERGVEIRLEVAPEVGEIQTDANKLEQVLSLLLDNVFKYAGPGTATLTAQASGPETIVILVGDCGRGVDAQLLPTLFETFSEGQVISHAQRGPGLGLPLARRLCRLMQGELVVETTGPAGTTMRIDLPRVYAPLALAA